MPDDMMSMMDKSPMSSDSKTVMVPKDICPGMTFNPGDEMVLRVKDVKGDMLEMEYAPEHGDESEMSSEDMNKPEMTEPMKNMPSDKMRSKLPKAQREGY